MKISIGNDHAGPDYKKAIVEYLVSKGHEVTNYGTDTVDSVDYPDFGHPVATDVARKSRFWNRNLRKRKRNCNDSQQTSGVRAALCWTKEIAYLAR